MDQESDGGKSTAAGPQSIHEAAEQSHRALFLTYANIMKTGSV